MSKMPSNTVSGSVVRHPYLPKDLSLPHYVPNVKSRAELLGIFALVCAVLVVVTWWRTGRRREPFNCFRRLSLCWFVLCACIHTFLEGYFAVYHATLAGHSSFLGEMWKEYSQCDSRYISSDTFTVCMESVTAAIDGPLALVTFFAFMNGSNYRYALQMILSLLQLYGDVLYFLTAIKDGFNYGPTDSPLYFYFYFLFLNSLWIIIPLILIIDSAHHIAACQTVSDFYIDEFNRKVSAHTNNHHKKIH